MARRSGPRHAAPGAAAVTVPATTPAAAPVTAPVTTPVTALLAAVAAALLALPLSGCNAPHVASAWRSGEISIDGRPDDWPRQSISSFEKIRLGVANDSTSLYLLLTTTDRRLSFQALGGGVQARFGSGNGPGSLWIGSPCSYVLGRGVSPGEPEDHRGDGGGAGSSDRGPGPPLSSDEMTERIRRAIGDLPEEIQVFSASGEDSLILSSTEAARRGIEVREGADRDGRFIVEMKVPLCRDIDHPHAIGVSLEPPEPAVDLELRIPPPDANAPAFRGDRDGADLHGGKSSFLEAARFRGGLAQSVFPPRRQGDLFPQSQQGRGRGTRSDGLDVTFHIRLSRPPSTAP